MRVHLWTGGHTIAESLITDPPPGITIESNITRKRRDLRNGTGERTFSVSPTSKAIVDKVVYAAGIPRFLPTLSDADLIHTISGLVPIVPRPWVTTISMPSSFFGLHDEWSKSPRHIWTIKRIIRSSRCRAIMSFSEATRTGLQSLLKGHLRKEDEEKLSVVYPAVNRDRFSRGTTKDKDKFRILFVGNHFFDKGGRELFTAASRLADRYDIHLNLVTDAPPHHKEAFAAFVKAHQEKWVSWYIPKVPRRRLIDEFFPNSDVFVMCSYIDVFGFVLIEAMASGLPLIAANTYAQKEIVDEGENGFLIDVPITPFVGNPSLRTREGEEEYRKRILSDKPFHGVAKDIEERLVRLIEDSGLRNRMSQKSMEMTTNGKFSISHRNAILGDIYARAAE